MIGNIALGGVAGEVFNPLYMRFKKESPYRSMMEILCTRCKCRIVSDTGDAADFARSTEFRGFPDVKKPF